MTVSDSKSVSNLSPNLPHFTDCELFNLAQIAALFPTSVILSAEELAVLLKTTANNIHQKLSRGQIPFDTVRSCRPYLFPVPMVAAWLCGKFEVAPCSVSLPKKTRARVRSASDLKNRLVPLKLEIEKRAKKLREADDQTGFKKAKIEHEKISLELVKLVESQDLAAFAGVPLNTPQKSRKGF